MKKKIAIFCNSLMGPMKGGGSGVIHLAIAEVLSEAGHSVTIYLQSQTELSSQTFRDWKKILGSKGIRLELIPGPAGWLEMPEHGMLSYAIYELLKTRHYDVVHFIDATGLGYYPMLAKKAGLAFENTFFFVTIAGSYYWHLRENRFPFVPHVSSLDLHFLERKSPELADVVCSPTRFALQWGKDRGWKFPKRTFVLPYPLNLERSLVYQGRRDRFDEVVYFGRLETRKGLETFCQAIESLPPSALKGKTVTFLGQCGFVAKEVTAGLYFKEHSKKWRFRWKLITRYDQAQAIDYLRSRNALAVVASRSETFGYTVAECASIGIPFICSPIPPFLEILSPESREKALYDGTAEGLAGKISKTLAEGQPEPPELVFDYAQVRERWKQIHDELKPGKARRRARRGRPRVSVCIVYKDRPSFLEQCLEGILGQTRLPDEILIVDNASTTPLERKKAKVLRLPRELSVSEARNRAARMASGEYILFLDDDDVPKPRMIEVLLKAATLNDADIVTCGFERFPGEGPPNPEVKGPVWIPFGDAIECGLFYNPFGHMSALIRRKPFLRIGGLKPTAPGAGEEDTELYARAILKGRSLVAVPEPLLWYRTHPGNRSHETNFIDSSHHRLSAYLGPAMEPLAHLIASFQLDGKKRSEEFAKLRESFGVVLESEHRRSFTKLLFEEKTGDKSSRLVQRRIRIKPGAKTRLSFPALRLENVRRVMVEIKSFGSGKAWIELRCKGRSADGALRWMSCAREIPSSPRSVQLVLDAVEFAGSPEIALSGPGWRVFHSVRLLGETAL